MKYQGLITRMLVQTLVSMAVIGIVLFIAAGDWRWLQAWMFLAETTVLSIAISLWLVRHDPALLETRLSPPFQRDQKRWDRLFMVSVLFLFMAWMVVIGLDARFGLSTMPAILQGVGAILIALCMLACWQVFRFNSFAAPQVRIQADRAQTVIDTGPYGIVRHPIYTGLIFGMLVTGVAKIGRATSELQSP